MWDDGEFSMKHLLITIGGFMILIGVMMYFGSKRDAARRIEDIKHKRIVISADGLTTFYRKVVGKCEYLRESGGEWFHKADCTNSFHLQK
jgi:hypothetical protein